MINRINRFLKTGSDRSLKAKKNIIGSIAIKGWSILIQLILVPLTMGYLSPEIYGIWLTVSSIMLWLNFFDIGFTLGLKNKLNEALAVGDIKKGRILVSTTYTMMLIIFIPIAFLLEIIVPYINWSSFLNIAETYNHQIIDVMRILIICFCLQMIFNTITAILAAYQRTALSNLFPVIGNTMSVIIIFILTKTVPPSLVNLAQAISYLPVIVLLVSSIILFRGSLKDISPSLHLFKKEFIPHLFSLGFKFFIIQIQFVVLYQATNVLISNISSPEEVTAYNIAYKYLSVGAMIFTIILGPLWPAYTDAYAKKDFVWMKNIYTKMKRLYAILVFGVMIMIAISPYVYRFWINSASIVPWTMTISVGIYVLIHSWDSLQITLINGIGAVKLQTYVTLIGLILHIPLSLLIGKFIGGVGVICSMAIINLIYSVIFTIQTSKLISNKATYIWKS